MFKKPFLRRFGFCGTKIAKKMPFVIIIKGTCVTNVAERALGLEDICTIFIKYKYHYGTGTFL